MIAELFIVPESFNDNDNFTLEEIEGKVKSLSYDFIEIRKLRATNRIYVHSDIYNINFINGLTIADLLYNPEVAKANLDRDVYNALKTIVIESANAEYTTEEIIEVLLPGHNEDFCYGLIAFDTIPNIDENYQIIYSIQGWYTFRRYFLGTYPKNASFFIEECKNYFPNLFFHERVKQTIGSMLTDCAKTVVYHLTQLNDKFHLIEKANLNRSELLVKFSVECGLPAHASLQGNPDKKSDFEFEFLNDKDELTVVCCEPHLKLCYNDNYPGDQSYSNDRRIYFHEGVENISNGNIVIGHIGKHL